MKLKLVTHDGSFHADDIFAAATLATLLERDGKEYEIIRTRDEEIIKTADYVFDVGGVHDEAINRFDHHQVGGAGSREFGGMAIEYAAFGLVWKRFGAELAGSQEIADVIDKRLVAPIDAGDNGMPVFDKKGEVGPYTIQSFLQGAMNPTWQEDATLADQRFLESVEIAKMILKREIVCGKDFIQAKANVLKCYEAAHDKRIIIFDGLYPVKDTLDIFPDPLFIISQRRNDGLWSLKTLGVPNQEFKNKKDLPLSWAGLRDKELQEVTGVEDAIFCHRNLFLAVAKSKEGALKLAELALKNS